MTPPITSASLPEAAPGLASGQHLSRAEFHRRYEAMPHLKKAELIQGVVYVPSPTRFGHHSQPHLTIATWLGVYVAHTPGTRAGTEATVRLGPSDEPEPDAILLIDPTCGGQAGIDADDYISGAPELVVQVAASSVDLDLGPRREAYRRAGVCEYIVWRVTDTALDWFRLREGQYALLQPVAGTLRSETFPGLWLDVQALLRKDMPSVLQVLQQGLASAEHANFVDRLVRATGPH